MAIPRLPLRPMGATAARNATIARNKAAGTGRFAGVQVPKLPAPGASIPGNETNPSIPANENPVSLTGVTTQPGNATTANVTGATTTANPAATTAATTTAATTTAAAKPKYFTSQYGTKIDVSGLSAADVKKVTDLANAKYGTRAAAYANSVRAKIPKAPTAPAMATPTQTTSTPEASIPATGGAPVVPGQSSAEALFPGTRMFEPQNYEGSPLYKFQVQEGQKQLAKSLAAKGLTGSGKAIEDELNVNLRAAAQDTDRMTRIASENADRLYNMQNNEALRQERAGNSQWDRQFSLAQLMAEQSPWSAALAGLNNTADLTSAQGKEQANYLREAIRRAIASGGGGGGVRATVPAGPDYSNIDLAGLTGGASSRSGWTNLLTQGLASLFK